MGVMFMFWFAEDNIWKCYSITGIFKWNEPAQFNIQYWLIIIKRFIFLSFYNNKILFCKWKTVHYYYNLLICPSPHQNSIKHHCSWTPKQTRIIMEHCLFHIGLNTYDEDGTKYSLASFVSPFVSLRAHEWHFKYAVL